MEPATVIAISQDGPSSYIVNTPGGQSYRRNRRHLKPAPSSLNAKRHYQADHSCDDWLEDASISDEADATETEIPAGQNSVPSPPL